MDALQNDDLRTISNIGQALWAEPVRSERMAVETLAAVSLLDLSGDQLLERTTQALLSRAAREGTGAAGPAIQNAFYRLSPEERLVLAALHQGKWSYARIARVLGKTPERVAEIAWAARLYLVSVPGRGKPVPHPTGSSWNALHCPEYNPQRPWTQSFLDDEMASREKVFLQDHLLACSSCRQSLSTCRQTYYAAEGMIPRLQNEEEARVKNLARALARSEVAKDPLKMSLQESVWIFLERPDVRLFLFLMIALLIAIGATGPAKQMGYR
jgi:hypothetical protein